MKNHDIAGDLYSKVEAGFQETINQPFVEEEVYALDFGNNISVYTVDGKVVATQITSCDSPTEGLEVSATLNGISNVTSYIFDDKRGSGETSGQMLVSGVSAGKSAIFDTDLNVQPLDNSMNAEKADWIVEEIRAARQGNTKN